MRSILIGLVLLIDRLLDFLASQGDAAGRRKREGDVRRLRRSNVAMEPPQTERSDLRVMFSTVGQEEETGVGEASSVESVERRGWRWTGSPWSENSVVMTGAALSRSTVVTV